MVHTCIYIIVHPGPCSLAGACAGYNYEKNKKQNTNMYKQTLKNHIFI